MPEQIISKDGSMWKFTDDVPHVIVDTLPSTPDYVFIVGSPNYSLPIAGSVDASEQLIGGSVLINWTTGSTIGSLTVIRGAAKEISDFTYDVNGNVSQILTRVI